MSQPQNINDIQSGRKKRIASMVRVSTEEQAKYGYSLGTQVDGCRKYAQEKGFEVVAELVDSCSGTIPIAERPQGKQIYDLVEAKAVDAVVLFTLDRTARDEKVIEYLMLKSYLYDHGVELHYTDTGLDPYTMEGNLVGYIKANAAAEERKKIRERSMRGRDGKAASGKIVASGLYPYGYRKVGVGRTGDYQRQEDELYTVFNMFHWYINGKDGSEPLTERQIAEVLAQTGAALPYGGKWTRTSVEYILKNELYAGVWYWGKTRVVNGKRKKMPKSSWTPVPRPDLAVIDSETFFAVQEKMANNNNNSRRNVKNEYLLRGHLFCGHCKHTRKLRNNKDGSKNMAMIGSSGRVTKKGLRTSINYRCSSHWHKEKHEQCPNNSPVAAAKVETIVWDWLVSLLSNKNKLLKGIKEWQASYNDVQSTKEYRYQQVSALLKKEESKLERLTNRYNDEEDEILAVAIYEQMKSSSKQIAGLREEKVELEEEMSRGNLTDAMVDELLAWADGFAKKMADPTFGEKRAILDYLNVSAVVTEIPGEGRVVDVYCHIRKRGDRFYLDGGSASGSGNGGDNGSGPKSKPGGGGNGRRVRDNGENSVIGASPSP